MRWMPAQEGFAAEGGAAQVTAQTLKATATENHSGIWLSRYEYYSSGREETFEAKHYVVVLQHGARLTGQSLPGAATNPDSPLTLDLTPDRNVVTGTWTEQTARDSYYQGAPLPRSRPDADRTDRPPHGRKVDRLRQGLRCELRALATPSCGDVYE